MGKNVEIRNKLLNTGIPLKLNYFSHIKMTPNCIYMLQAYHVMNRRWKFVLMPQNWVCSVCT